jgi:hypothetical protein
MALLILVFGFGAFLHYVLPQRDVVRIVGAEPVLTELGGWNSVFFARPDNQAANTSTSRDIRFINTVSGNGRTRVYRNEDTGFLWPPYFKFDSQDLQTEALNFISNADDPRWVVITHYGWRSNLLSIYPNAISIRAVDGPDAQFFPWLNLIILALIMLGLFMIWRMIERFKDRVIDPFVDGVMIRWAKTKDRLSGRG